MEVNYGAMQYATEYEKTDQVPVGRGRGKQPKETKEDNSLLGGPEGVEQKRKLLLPIATVSTTIIISEGSKRLISFVSWST